MRKTIITAAALLTGAWTTSATVTVQGWWHFDSSQPINDSSGNGRTFGSAFSTAPGTGGSFAGLVVDNGAGGPLGTTGFSSTNCVRMGIGVGSRRQSSMWGIGYNPPATNYGIEVWVMPQDNGIAGGNNTWIFSSGQTGGVKFRLQHDGNNIPFIYATIIGPETDIGLPVQGDTNRWMHLALVNNGGVTTFYTNGIPCGPSNTNGATASAGDVYIGTPSDNQAYYGYIDEARMFTFALGQFSTNDLLLRAKGPNIIGQPQNATVWTGGAAPFKVNPSFDFTTTYQWRRGGVNQSSGTNSSYVVPLVTAPDSGSTFDCVLTSLGISRTSSVATLTVIAANPSNISAYRSAVQAEPSLLAYFPVDNNTGSTLTNVVDAAHNGTLELNATYDGRTNTSFGQRALSLNADGDVQIPNNPAFEFGSGAGNGTVELLLDLSQPLSTDPTIFSQVYDGGGLGYLTFRASANGNGLVYLNDGITPISWLVPGGLIGKLSHVALVFDNGTNVTAYVNGQNLGTQAQASFGSATGAPAWIGGMGTSVPDNRLAGTIDELAIYGSALSQNTIQVHYSKFVFGTNTSAPSIVSQPASRSVLAGASPVLVVNTSGTLPLSYGWTSNSVPIPGANAASLYLTGVTATATYRLWVTNGYGFTNTQPVVLTVTAPPSGYATVAMGDHPTAFWRLSESSGTTAIDSAGFNDGTYSGGVTLGATAFHGETGTGARLNGSSGRAIVPLTPVLNPNGPFTCEFWAAPTVTAFYVPVGSMDRPGRSGGYEFYLNGNYPGWEFHTAAGGGYSQIVGDNTAPPAGSWNHVVGIYDGVNLSLYVNGAPANPDFSLPVTITPNSVKGFYIGSRADDVRYFSGTMADVAFYNYALSELQISNHYAVSYQAASIVTQPVGATNTEGSTITLTVVANGLPNSYQWQKGGSDLSPINNFDGTPHYAQGVNASTLTISQAHPSDSGPYRVVISNPLGGATSVSVNVLVLADTTPPAVSAVIGLGTPNDSGPTPFLVKVVYNKRVDPVTGGDTTKYSFSPPVTISNVTVLADVRTAPLGGDWRTAYLVTSGLVPGQQYSLTVTGVKDQAETPNTIVPAGKSFKAPLLTQGAMEWDYYYLGTVSGVGSLLGNVNYPNAPQTNAYTSIFDSDQITGGDINNNPAFGSLGDNYGCSLSGWLTPTVSGNYDFFIASDDASQLLLSTDSNPANAVVIAQETGCCHGFQEPGNPTTTASPIPLIAGTNYFIRALQTEGGGGDYVKVAWRITTDLTAATNLPPIAAQYLKAYAPLPRPAFNPPVLAGTQLTISWTGAGTLQESTNLTTWTAVPGNPTSPYHVTVTTAPRKFYRVLQ